MNTPPPFPRIHDIGRALETWAPPETAQSYDNVGLQVGDGTRTVERAVVALDLTPAVLDEAIRLEASLIITHHPLLFRPLRTLTSEGFVSSLALRLAEARIALYSIHTNLDAARDGVSFTLAERLGLRDVRFLGAMDDRLLILTTYVPDEFRAAVFEAMTTAGAEPRTERPPPHGPENIARLEVSLHRWDLSRVVSALQSAHPSPDPAYDVYPVAQPTAQVGLGAIGELPSPMPLRAFLDRVIRRLDAGSLRYAGDPSSVVERIAVCGGSGSSYTLQALRAGADAFVTADVTYHSFFDVLGANGRPQMALIDAGHYETEAHTEQVLVEWLAARFPAVDWRRTSSRTSPVVTHLLSS